MNAKLLKQKIFEAVGYAAESEPVEIDARARHFIAALSGLTERHDPDLSAKIWSLIGPAVGSSE